MLYYKKKSDLYLGRGEFPQEERKALKKEIFRNSSETTKLCQG